jgi:hypothetical protein
MNRDEELQALNLNFLVTEFLLPEINDAMRETRPSGSRRRGAQLQGALFEIFGWMYLGVQVGYFHRQHATQLLKEHYQTIFPKKLMDDSLIRNLFPELEPILRRAIKGDFFPDMTADFREQGRLGTAFRTAFVLGSGFARDSLAQGFSTTLNFASEAFWVALTGEEKSKVAPDQILLALNLTGPAPVAVTAETLYAGFLRTLEHMDAARDLFVECERSDKTSLEELEFWRRVRQLQAWRVNLRDRKVRFMEVARKVNKEVISELNTPDLKYEPRFFLIKIEELVNYWLGEATDRSRERTATA